ncbi:fused response regulator/phosphatase [Paraglaciecola aquimarina]|uniref:Fused response regulator/phosphatase n=1 Tax=Paraglaciecola algarum TaxID=3050085 RepID=A0ABS9D2P9_9ALTE|nr:fused response regulator/phosphatase [Paraglaciecola sp. G1-23]MCF2946710.1 fused response regulator/phosphatase [Paraglaciecola sp. G1-23]
MRILVVDDDPINRFLLMNMLEQQGYVDTYEAENGKVALELAKQVPPDLVLLDAVMPEMDGYEAAPLLKESSPDSYLPIIFITAVDDEGALARCLEAGGDDFVSKPFDKVILSAKIRAHSRTRLLSKRANDQFKQLAFYQAAVEREHKIVEHIFANALVIDESLNDYIDYQLNPASTFNGDLFLMCSSPSGGMYFLMGDFTGHGLASSIGALPVSKAFNAMCRKGLSLNEISETINQTLLTLLPDDMFFAAIIVEIDKSGKRIEVWNGGMPPLVLQNDEGKIVKRFESKHMSLGILEDEDFDAIVERYEATYGDRLIGFSDGLVEIENASQNMLGESGAEQWLIKNQKITTQGLFDKVLEYLDGGERLDDITLVIFTCQPLKPIQSHEKLAKLPLKIISDLDAEDLKQGEPISSLVNVIANQLGLSHRHSAIFTVLSELYNNALDHGILKLDSKLKETDEGFFEFFTLKQERLDTLQQASIVLTTEFNPQKKSLRFQIQDSGEGFDPSLLHYEDDPEKAYGRGIVLVKQLCDSVKYSNSGNTVDVVFTL